MLENRASRAGCFRGTPARVAALLLVLGPGLAAGPAAARTRAARAEELYQRALVHLSENTVDTRRVAIDQLERATLLVPGTAHYELTLARTYLQAGFIRLARERFTRVSRLAPGDADARFGLGQVWRRDWLKYLETTSLDLAAENLRAAVRLSPAHCDAWLLLVPLLVEQGNLTAAAAAAWQARAADPGRPEALIADAYTAYQTGRPAYADSVFESAIPRLRHGFRERFEDIAPVASERDTFMLRRLPKAERDEFVRRFWKASDPDLATPENEARLEYWSRVSHAYFLYYDPKRREWDERGEVYVRYGPPSRAEYNPVGEKLYATIGEFGITRQLKIPANVLVWEYHDLGMRVVMQDRLLSEYYLLPIHLDKSMDPAPDPAALAALDGVVATPGGRGVFPALPPGVLRRPAGGALARFQGAGGPRLLCAIETAGPPDDSLKAELVVLDSARTEVTRQRRMLTPSACDPVEAQVADFAAETQPGEYLVGVTVHDQGGRRGIFRETVRLSAPEADLELSDVVISCGLVDAGGAPAVRLEPNPYARVGGQEPLTAYFEIYHLATGREGRSRFEFIYTVRSAERDPRNWIQRMLRPRREPPPISATRAEEQPGSMRRQFVRVPVQSLPPGPYRLEITVRDLLAGRETTGEASFVRLAETAPGN